ncbi:SoxR reducing system RseC family protein [Thiohalorhabdus sp.]|uniref:SoxR reducing system RseC family protein n=1 Tax=Thiohalorhabdus sp. TaxID=3094134 RepID=UPI002FC32D48
MIETEAVVVGTEDDVVEVQSAASAGCGRCSTQGGCGGGRTILGTRPGGCRMRVYGELAVRPGDRVVVGLPESGYLRASVALYVVPLAGMFAAGGVAEWLVNRFNPANGDVLILIAGLAGLGGGFLWQRGFNRRMADDPRFRARLLRRAHPGDGSGDPDGQAA